MRPCPHARPCLGLCLRLCPCVCVCARPVCLRLRLCRSPARSPAPPPARALRQIEELEANKRALQTKVLDLKGLQDSLEKRNAELRLQEETRMQEENDFLSFQAQSLEQFLKQTQA